VSAHGTGFFANAGCAASPARAGASSPPPARSDPTSSPSLVNEALRLHELGLVVLPAQADDGKSVAGVVKGLQNWRTRPPRTAVE
jgi:hypothetical protein